MLTYPELIEKLKEIKKMGWVKTHRKGPTGIGKTLEDLLEITENNVPGPDAHEIELKSARKDSKSMLTLFTKAPLPRNANSVLLKNFGYDARGNGKLDLHTTVNALDYNTLRGKIGFKIDIEDDKIKLVTKDSKSFGLSKFIGKESQTKSKKEVHGYWDREILKTCFERKLPQLMFVKADSKGKGENEEFLFNEAWILSGFDFDNLINLLKSGDILVDVRIGQYSDGRPHDHGTGFRVHLNKLNLCFKNRKKIM